MPEKTDVLIVIHSLFTAKEEPVSGTGSSLFELFDIKNIPYTCYHLPIYGQARVVEISRARGKVHRIRGESSPASFLRRTVFEGITVFTRLIKNPVCVYIGIDPLNALWGIIGKFVFRRVRTVIYYTADYADARFDNSVMNAIYHVIDRLSLRLSDQVWNVSKKIYELRTRQGVPAEKNYFVPNAPISVLRRKSNYDKFALVCVGTSAKALDFDIVLDALPKIVKTYPSVTFHIAGTQNFPEPITEKIRRLEQKGLVVPHGPLSHDDVTELLSKSGIGLALYKNAEPWTAFGDSMKMREYFAAGLPVITTDVVPTSEDVRNFGCGVVIPTSAEKFISAVNQILSGDAYERMHAGSVKAATALSYPKMVRKPLSLVGVTV